MKDEPCPGNVPVRMEHSFVHYTTWFTFRTIPSNCRKAASYSINWALKELSIHITVCVAYESLQFKLNV